MSRTDFWEQFAFVEFAPHDRWFSTSFPCHLVLYFHLKCISWRLEKTVPQNLVDGDAQPNALRH